MADLSGAEVSGAEVSGAEVVGTELLGAMYDAKTQFSGGLVPSDERLRVTALSDAAKRQALELNQFGIDYCPRSRWLMAS
jgi:hypothetical protein